MLSKVAFLEKAFSVRRDTPFSCRGVEKSDARKSAVRFFNPSSAFCYGLGGRRAPRPVEHLFKAKKVAFREKIRVRAREDAGF